MKKLFRDWRWYALIVFLAVGAALMGSDIQRGITFSTTEHITNVKLHNLIDEATINTTFVTDLSAAQPTASDVFLFVQPGTPIYRKTTYNTLLLSATNLITSQSELDLPVTNDFVFMFDTSAGTLVKVPLIAIFTNASTSLWGPDYTNVPAGGFSYPFAYQGNSGHIEHSNLFAGWWQWERFSTNIGAVNPLTNTPLASIHTAPTNADMIRIWDAAGQTNKFTTLAGLMTNAPPVPESKLTNSDSLLVFSRSTNAFVSSSATGVVAQVSLTNLAHFVAQKYTAAGIPIPVAAGPTANGFTNLHGLAGTPQFWKAVIVCTNAEGTFMVGDEVDLMDAVGTGSNGQGINSSNYWFTATAGSTYAIRKRDGSGSLSITKANWNIKVDAIYFP